MYVRQDTERIHTRMYTCQIRWMYTCQHTKYAYIPEITRSRTQNVFYRWIYTYQHIKCAYIPEITRGRTQNVFYRWIYTYQHIKCAYRPEITCGRIACHTYEWVMSHKWMSHVTHMNESCNTYEWVMSHIWTSHVTHMDEWLAESHARIHALRIIFIHVRHVWRWCVMRVFWHAILPHAACKNTRITHYLHTRITHYLHTCQNSEYQGASVSRVD